MSNVIHLADRSPAIREHQLAAHQAELLLAPYRFGLATMLAGAMVWVSIFILRIEPRE